MKWHSGEQSCGTQRWNAFYNQGSQESPLKPGETVHALGGRGPAGPGFFVGHKPRLFKQYSYSYILSSIKYTRWQLHSRQQTRMSTNHPTMFSWIFPTNIIAPFRTSVPLFMIYIQVETDIKKCFLMEYPSTKLDWSTVFVVGVAGTSINQIFTT